MSVKDFELWWKARHQTVDSGELQVCQSPCRHCVPACARVHARVCVCVKGQMGFEKAQGSGIKVERDPA